MRKKRMFGNCGRRTTSFLMESSGGSWNTRCPLFCLPYEQLPAEVHFRYDGKVVQLSEETEECATFYGRILDHDYTTKEVFNKNFFKDWRKTMNAGRKDVDKGPVKMRLHRN